MREIKFRAKSGTQWRYGDLYHNEHGELVIYESLTKGKTLDGAAVLGWRIKVDPDTVGQYTGLLDADGREIYEGDVLGAIKTTVLVEWGLDGWVADCFTLSEWLKLHDSRVIGNVHDNPDLLEVAHD